MNIFDKMSSYFQTKTVEVKSSAVGMLVAMYTAGRAMWSKRDYKQYAEEGFQKCVIAYACINKVNQAIKYIPVVLMKGDKKVEEHEILDLLAKPNPRQTQQGLMEAMAGFYQVAGNVYLEMVPTGVDPKAICSADKLPAELYVLRSDLMKIVADPKGGIMAFRFEINSQGFDYKVDPLDFTCNIIHMKTWHPTDFHYGLSPMEPAAISVVAHNAATVWNQALLENSGTPSGALMYKPDAAMNLTPEQRQSVKEQLEANIVGSRNAGRPLVLDGDWTWQQMGLTPADMDWLNSKTVSAKEVCMAFGVPPYLMGIADPTFNNAREGRAIFYEDTVIPLAESILEHLNQFLCPLYGDDFHLELDLNKIQALAPRRTETWTMVNTSTCLTTNEKRGLLGFELVDDPTADEIMVPSTTVPLSTKLDPPEPAPGVDANGDPIPGNEDDPDADGDDDLSPGRDGAPPADDSDPDAGSGKPGNPAPPKGPIKPGTKPAAKAVKGMQQRIEREALRIYLKHTMNLDADEAKDLAALAWGGKRGRRKA